MRYIKNLDYTVGINWLRVVYYLILFYLIVEVAFR